MCGKEVKTVIVNHFFHKGVHRKEEKETVGDIKCQDCFCVVLLLSNIENIKHIQVVFGRSQERQRIYTQDRNGWVQGQETGKTPPWSGNWESCPSKWSILFQKPSPEINK